MHFPSTLVLVAAAAASVARAQVTINPTTITQCATNSLTYAGSSGPYYVAVLNGADLCGDALAEFYNVDGTSVDYFANVPSGSQVQILVVDSSEQETYSEMVTVGDGDASCLPGASSSSSSSETPTSSDAPASYTPPARTTSPASAMTYTPSSNDDDDTSNSDDTPVNAQSDSTTSGATAVSASASLVLGAIVAVAALF